MPTYIYLFMDIDVEVKYKGPHIIIKGIRDVIENVIFNASCVVSTTLKIKSFLRT